MLGNNFNGWVDGIQSWFKGLLSSVQKERQTDRQWEKEKQINRQTKRLIKFEKVIKKVEFRVTTSAQRFYFLEFLNVFFQRYNINF